VISLCASESGGGELGDVLSFFCLRVKVAAGAVSAGSTTLTLVGRRGRFGGQHHIDAGIGLVLWIPRTP